jgi:hypothetical protein
MALWLVDWLADTGWEGFYWIRLAQDEALWLAACFEHSKEF